MESLRTLTRELLETTCEHIKAQKLDDPHEDLPLTVLYMPKGSHGLNLIVPISPEGQVDPQMMLMVSLQAALAKWGPPDVIVHSADARMKTMPRDYDFASYQHGDFAIDPSSREVLVVTAYCRDDDELAVIGRYMPYGYDDDGSIRFDEVIDLEGPPGGGFDDIIKKAFEHG